MHAETLAAQTAKRARHLAILLVPVWLVTAYGRSPALGGRRAGAAPSDPVLSGRDCERIGTWRGSRLGCVKRGAVLR